MRKIKYRIYRLSARAVMGYGQQDGDWFFFSLNKSATEQCMLGTLHEQEDNALFYQIMDELHGGKFSVPADGKIVTDLENVIFYMDFSGILTAPVRRKNTRIGNSKRSPCSAPRALRWILAAGSTVTLPLNAPAA